MRNFNLEEFLGTIIKTPQLSMLWGDLGVGKTSLALQLSKEVLKKGIKKKVFYLNTKASSYNDLYSRILGTSFNSLDSNFFLWCVDSFELQIQVVNQWILQINQLNVLSSSHEFINQVGLIVIDEISNHYLLSLGSDKVNKKINEQFSTHLALLKSIIKTHNIPIVLVNSSILKNNEVQIGKTVYHGGKIIKYWTDLEIHLSRTSQPSIMQFKVEKQVPNWTDLEQWKWELSDPGFNDLKS